jgi:hypothetical protein
MNTQTKAVLVRLAPATRFTSSARLRVEQPAKLMKTYVPAKPLPLERGAYVVPLAKTTTWIELTASR